VIRTIVVPLDGSALADFALPHARGLAAESGAVVVLVRAVHGWDTPGGKVAAVEEAEVYLRQVQSSPALAGVTVHIQVVSDHPAQAIARVATQRDADLIVMGTHDRSGLGLILHGSVAGAVLRGTTVPVLLVPPVRRPRVRAGTYRTLLIPLDGSAPAESALHEVISSGFAPHATILLVRAVKPSLVYQPAPLGGTPPQVLWQEDQEIERRLADGRSYLHSVTRRETGRRLEPVGVTLDEPASAIARAVDTHGVDVVAMTTQARRGGRHLVDSSVAGAVLHRVDVPVLLLYGGANPGDGAARLT
jgi:nucleotide-binding universal stress UspA family protein